MARKMLISGVLCKIVHLVVVFGIQELGILVYSVVDGSILHFLASLVVSVYSYTDVSWC